MLHATPSVSTYHSAASDVIQLPPPYAMTNNDLNKKIPDFYCDAFRSFFSNALKPKQGFCLVLTMNGELLAINLASGVEVYGHILLPSPTDFEYSAERNSHRGLTYFFAKETHLEVPCHQESNL